MESTNLVLLGWLHGRKVLAGNADVTFLIIQEYSTGSTNHITDNTFLGNKLRILEYEICRHDVMCNNPKRVSGQC